MQNNDTGFILTVIIILIFFQKLNSVEHSLSDTEAKEDDDRENEPPQEGQDRNKLEKQDSTHSTDSLKRRKKKKKKKLKSQKSTEENLDDGVCLAFIILKLLDGCIDHSPRNVHLQG